jgi:CspA family cold shock protein
MLKRKVLLDMMEGTVKWYSEKKGYGFIETENDGDIFMHSRSIKDHGFFLLQKSDKVTFEIKETRHGRQAANVRIVK